MVKGYKVFNSDWTCRGFQYEVGKTYTLTGALRICDNGFHFCEKVAACFNYYDFDPDNRVAEVEALGEVQTDGDKSATNQIRIVREIRWAEMLELANTGKWNSGHSNAGHYNAGDRNAGHCNAGHRNAGDRNTGHHNAGDNNAGDFNSCNWSTGTFCSIEPPFLLFNKPSPISRDELHWHPGFKVARRLRVVDDEGKPIAYKQAWANLWDDCLDSDKIAIQSLPNFDADVFYEITGIRV